MEDNYGREPPKVTKILMSRIIDRDEAFDAVRALLQRNSAVEQALREDVRQVAEALASIDNKEKLSDASVIAEIPETPAAAPNWDASAESSPSTDKKRKKSERKAAKKAKKEAKKAKKEAKKKRKRESFEGKQ